MSGACVILRAGRCAGLVCAALSAWLIVAGFVLDALFPFPRHVLEKPASTRVFDRKGEPVRFFLATDEQWRFPVRLQDVSPLLLKAVIASEDRWFYVHPGVNPLAVARAAWANLLAGRVVSGGSTIPMQLARMAQPRERTLWAKCVEALRALQLDAAYSKDELLEFYLNMAPYGGNVAGVGAGAWFICGKAPSRLSLAEAALLTALPRAPNSYRPDRTPEAARQARGRVLDQLADRGAISAREAATAKRAALPARLVGAPMQAPHAARLALQLSGRQARVTTTIDMDMQRSVEAVLAGRAGWLRRQDLANAAAAVLDIHSREVLAMAGSLDFFEQSAAGQMNLALAERSPGSTLKPFLYGLAMDQGVLVPQSKILDLPTDYAGYVARNYDETYRGEVTVEQALAESLNAPAVRALARVGVSSFLDLLLAGGLRTLDRPVASYGLPLALGGCEARLVDLVNLYACLADRGAYKPWRLRATTAPPTEKRLLSPEAAHLVLEILQQVERPDLPQSWDLAADVPAVAWKTGTSFGHRDAWAVGVSGSLAIGVWVGNPDGAARKGISGSTHAGPVLFDLFRALERRPAPLPSAEGLQYSTVQACAVSRQLAGPDCPHTISMRVIPGVTQLERCSAHRRIFVDSATGERLAGDCVSRRPHEPRVVEVDPAELTAWRMSRSGEHTDTGLPRLSPLCMAAADDGALAIVSPDSSTPYRLRRWAPDSFQRIALLARMPQTGAKLSWYLDGSLAATAAAGEQRFVYVPPGEHRVSVVDSAGRMDAVSFSVQ